MTPVQTLGGNLIWPYITAKPDGSKMYMMSSFSGGPGTVHMVQFDAALGQFGTHGPALATEDGDTLDSGGRYNVVVSPSGNKVTMYHLGGPDENYVSFSESTDGGATFPAFKRLTKLTPSRSWHRRHYNTNRLDCAVDWMRCRVSWRKPCFRLFNWAICRSRLPVQRTRYLVLVASDRFCECGGYEQDSSDFPWLGRVHSTRRAAAQQVNHFPIDYPSIGVTPNGDLHCVFAVARRDTSAQGRNFYTVAYTKSTNGGASWSNPVLLEDNPTQDFRYPSIAESNPDNNFVNIVYQQDPVPGSSAFNDNAPISRAQLLFRRFSTLSSRDNAIARAESYRLEQNYPNPFNPTTNITYVLPKAENVSLKVYDVLGREVATLVNEVKPAGAYTVPFNASNLASGVYFYKLQAGSFVQTKKDDVG
jgi:hypothetical protein